jgi:hypothetical protein
MDLVIIPIVAKWKLECNDSKQNRTVPRMLPFHFANRVMSDQCQNILICGQS